MDIIFHPITSILKLHTHTIDALHRLDIYLVRDLLLHKPHSYISKKIAPNLSNLKPGERIITEVIIREITLPQKHGVPIKIYADNDTGGIMLVFFNKIPQWIFNQLRPGVKKVIEGKVEWNDFYYQISHPDFILDTHRACGIEPVYPLTYGINNKQLHGYILQALDAIVTSINTQDLLIALRYIHSPIELAKIDQYMRQLAYYELLANQLSLSFIRQNNLVKRGRSFVKADRIQQRILDNLGFSLHDSQKSAIQEIERAQSIDTRMSQMLQGDVGSGKTLVALMTMLNVAAANVQSALMAPTDLLATQHFNFFTKALRDTDIEVALLTGKTKIKDRREILEKLTNGSILMLIGTHALFQTQVFFKDLGYIIIDEQHKFGVMQRMELLSKATHPDLLVMTATPIPRSLTMTWFGDMSISRLTSKSTNKPTITTILKNCSKLAEVLESLERKIEKGEKIYWVCPLIEQEEEKIESSLYDVTTRFNALNILFPGQVGLLHGRLPGETKDEVMQQFKDGTISILVSTTVIEVGIDVPEATLIVIENAERFGLAQLHQLRGRVGRGNRPSHCILLYEYLAGIAKTRLEIMRISHDGFYIAEQDLLLRGGGEILGTKQSGQVEFRFADLARDLDILEKCNKIAQHESYEQYQWLIKLFHSKFANKDHRA